MAQDSEEILFNQEQLSFEILQQFNVFRKQGLCCDFEIVVSEVSFSVHEAVLCANSEYFKVLLQTDNAVKQSQRVELLNLDPQCVAICVDFMYGQQIFSDKNKWWGMIEAAERLQVIKLFDIVTNHLRKNTDVDSVYDIWNIAQIFHIDGLKEHCAVFAAEHAAVMKDDKRFKILKAEHIGSILSCKDKGSESAKLASLIDWVMWDRECRTDFFSVLFAILDLSKVAKSYRRYLLESEPLIAENVPCFKQISISLLDSTGVQRYPFCNYEKKDCLIIFDDLSGRLQQIYPGQNRIKQLQHTELKIQKGNFAAVHLQDAIYLIMKDKLVYEMKLNSPDGLYVWRVRKSMDHDHGARPPIVTDGKCLYVVYGGQNRESDHHIERYDPGTDTWDCIAKRQCRHSHSCVLVNYKIYCIGGIEPPRNPNENISMRHVMMLLQSPQSWRTSTMESYDLRYNKITALKALPTLIECSVSAAVGMSIYVIGGTRGNREFTLAECYREPEIEPTFVYDINTDMWSELRQFINIGQCVGACVMKGDIYVISRNKIQHLDVSRNECRPMDVDVSRLNISYAMSVACPD